MSEIDFNEQEIYTVLINLNPMKAIGIDGIGPQVLKNYAGTLYQPLRHLFHACNMSVILGSGSPTLSLKSPFQSIKIIFPFQQLAQDQLLTLNLHISIQLTILIGNSILQDCLVYGIPCQSLTLINHSLPSKLNSNIYSVCSCARCNQNSKASIQILTFVLINMHHPEE